MAESDDSQSNHKTPQEIHEQYPMISELVEDKIYPFVENVLTYFGFG